MENIVENPETKPTTFFGKCCISLSFKTTRSKCSGRKKDQLMEILIPIYLVLDIHQELPN